MKNIFKTILCIVSFFVPVFGLFAQEQQYVPDVYYPQNEDGTGIVYSKQVQGPNEKGEYSIFLKTFVTGEADEEIIKVASDIVLVLDVSGSMAWGMGDDDFQSAGTSFTPNQINNSTYMYKRGEDDYHYVRRASHNNYYVIYISIDGTNYYFTNSGALTEDVSNAYHRSGNQTIYNGTLYQVKDASHTRLAALKEAVNYFIGEIKKDNSQNRVAIVKFANENFYPNNNNPDSSTETGSHTNNGNYTEIVNGFLPCTSTTLTTNVSNLSAGGATAADFGMRKAKALINSLYTNGQPDDNTNKLVVFFTDGEPTWNSSFEVQVAEDAIGFSKDIKGLTAFTITTESGKTVTEKVKVYTIGTFKKPTPRINTYMQRLSSNYPNATGIDAGEEGADGGDYGFSFQASNKEDLIEAFESISSDVVNPDVNVSESSTVVDVVSKSFALPKGSNASKVQVWETKATGYEDGMFTFSINQSDWKNITSSVQLDTVSVPNTVSVTGWKFDKNACAVKADGGVLGKQLILEIPIEMGPSAVGGPDVGTNGPNSGITYKDENGVEQKLRFEPPQISLPISLYIRKEGLKLGESSKFKIQRMWDGETKIPADEVITPNVWQDYTSVFLTRRSTDTETGENAPLVKIVGLHPGFTYRIIEEGWSWSYGITKVHGSKYETDPDTHEETIKDIEMSNGSASDQWSGNDVLSTAININPFIFVNEKKGVEVKNGVTSVRHAESLVRNEFKKADGTTTGVSEYSKTQPQ